MNALRKGSIIALAVGAVLPLMTGLVLAQNGADHSGVVTTFEANPGLAADPQPGGGQLTVLGDQPVLTAFDANQAFENYLDARGLNEFNANDWSGFDPFALPQGFEFTTLDADQLGTGEDALIKALQFQTNALEQAGGLSLFPADKNAAGLRLLAELRALSEDDLTRVVANITPCSIVTCPPFSQSEVVGLAIKVGDDRRAERADARSAEANELAEAANTLAGSANTLASQSNDTAWLAMIVAGVAAILTVLVPMGSAFVKRGQGTGETHRLGDAALAQIRGEIQSALEKLGKPAPEPEAPAPPAGSGSG